MPALPSHLIDQLGDLAVDIREGYEANSGEIDTALGLLPAFTEFGQPRSALERALAVSEFKKSALRFGLEERTGPGGSAELILPVGNDRAILRFRSAEFVGEEPRMIANGAMWGGVEGLWREIPYVFGWTTDGHGSIDFFVAEVTGKTDHAVPMLIFGWIHFFNRPAPLNGAFKPDSGDNLDGWDRPAKDEDGRQAQ